MESFIIELCHDIHFLIHSARIENAGQDDPFDRGNYDPCERFRDEYNGKNPYYEGFVDGCRSVEGNTEKICESATD